MGFQWVQRVLWRWTWRWLRSGRQGQAIELCRRAAEEGGLLVGGVALGEHLEGVPQYFVVATYDVHREVAFEHAALGPESLDARLQIGRPVGRELGRRGRRV